MFERVLSFFRGHTYKDKERTSNSGDWFKFPGERKGRRIKEIFSNIPTLETKRLILRRIRVSDYSDMYEYSSDPDVTKYLTWYPHKTIDESKEYIEYLQKRYNDGKFFDWGLEHKDSRKFIGTCGFTSININNNRAEVGYVLAKGYWGQGIIPEALRAVMDFGFNCIGFDRIEARFMDGNDRSRKVMQKSGMSFEKILYNSLHTKGEYKTVHTYSISREKFNSRHEGVQAENNMWNFFS